MASRLVPPALNQAIDETVTTAGRAVDSLQREMAAFDPTLAIAVERSGRKIRYQLAKIERKAGREALRRNARAARDAASLYGLVYPERHLQERLYSILPFIAKHGTDLVERLYEVVQLDCPDHRLVVG
jgi:uncharacterized protein YllA (UPF0747 family)